MKLRSFTCLLVLALCVACGRTSGDAPEPGQAARELDANSKATLGVGVRSLAFLFEADPGTYLLRNSVSLEKAWRRLMALQAAGYVQVNSIQSVSGEMVEIVLTPKGESILKEFER